MSGAISPRVLNDAFASKLSSAEGKEKLAAYGGSYIRDRLREGQLCTQKSCPRAGNPCRLPAFNQP